MGLRFHEGFLLLLVMLGDATFLVPAGVFGTCGVLGLVFVAVEGASWVQLVLGFIGVVGVVAVNKEIKKPLKYLLNCFDFRT